MKAIKQYINNNKQIIIILLGAFTFLFLHNYAYCHPLVLTLITPAISYFSSISPEFYAGKIIDKVFEYSPWIMSKSFEYSPYVVYGTGILGITVIGLPVGVKVGEFVYNWRYFANQYAHNTPVIGSLLKGANTTYKWFTKKDLTNIEYTYFYPKIAKALGYPDLFNKKLEIDLSTFNSNLTSREPHVENGVHTVFVDTPINVVEFKDKAVYIPNTVYKDRENLLIINEKADKLLYATTESNLLKMGFTNGYQQLKDEITALASETNKQLSSASKDLFMTRIAYEDDLYFVTKHNKSGDGGILHRIEGFEYPLLKQLLLTGQDQEMYPYIQMAYKGNTSFFGTGIVPDFDRCKIGCFNPRVEFSLFDSEGLHFLLQQNQHFRDVENEQDFLIRDLRESINNGLINVETRDQGTQTAYYDLNETIYDRINSFLEVRDETSFIVASHEGRNLPFNNMQIKSYSKPQETVTTQTQETSVETHMDNQEISIQTETTANTITNVSASQLVSNLLQNSAMLFGGLIVAAASDNFQSFEMAAKLLAGFTHIPEYNQAFIAATQMSIADLQMEYGFGPDEARRAYETLGQAYDIRQHTSLPSDISSSLSDSTNHATNSGFGWKDYLLIGTTVIAAGCILYIGWQKIKTGSYIDGNEIHAVSPNIEAWKKALFDKINKL